MMALRAAFAGALLVLARVETRQHQADALDGTWKPIEVEVAGTKLPEDIYSGWRLELSKGRYVLKGAESPDSGTVAADASKKPKTMDITGSDGPNKGKSFPCIYEIDGDSLRICYDLAGKKRPAEFRTRKDTKLYLVTYRRQKD
jgi:uncharacterized protein (TIGR03067 family)